MKLLRADVGNDGAGRAPAHLIRYVHGCWRIRVQIAWATMSGLALSPIAPVLGQRIPLRGPPRLLYRSYARHHCPSGILVRKVTTQLGDDFSVDMSSWLEWQLWAFGGYEDHLGQLFGYLVADGDRCIDVGANIGIHTVRLAKLAGAREASLPSRRAKSSWPGPEVTTS